MVNIIVIGAGIIGVTTAYRLKVKYPSVKVTVVAKDFSPNTTSDGAAGIWEPYIPGTRSEENLDSIRHWSQETYKYLFSLLTSSVCPNSFDHGIVSVHCFSLSEDESFEPPFWRDMVCDFHILNEDDLRRFSTSLKRGFGFTTFTVQSTKYIPWLSRKFVDLGGQFIRKEVRSISEVAALYDVVINCTGHGAKQLLNDDKCYPIRGQLLRMRAPWVKEVVMTQFKNGRSCYIVPAQDHVVLGGVVDEEKRSDKVCLEDKHWIVSSTKSIMPSLQFAEELYDWVGFRPARTKIRLEAEALTIPMHDGQRKTVAIVHNYGHGGCGITTHWGCAGDAVQMVSQAIDNLQTSSKVSKL